MLKKIVTAFMLLLFMQTPVMSAADNTWWDGSKDDSPVTIGVQLGMNMASWNVERWGKTRFGVNFGVTAEIPVLKSFSVNTGLLFSMKGTQGDNDGGFGGNLKTTNTCNYIELPVLATWKTEGFRPGDRFRVMFGPYFAVGVYGNNSKDYTGSGIAQDSHTKESVFEYIKRFDWGLSVGLSYSFQERLSVGFCYEAGLMNLNKNLGSGSVRQSNFSINLGYKFLAL